jgi:eukaryotic-like serine/threonine-protein kinase
MHVMRQVCRSLAEAHAIGLVHRDIKPANIYACRMGLEYDFVKVLDFGLVRHENRADAPTLVTVRSVTMGTPGYMAPEVILGNHDTDRRADVYALGCVAYFLLTGQPVFEAEHPMKLLMRHVQETPLPPSRRAEHPIPREIDDFVMACLQKDPDGRPHSAEDALRLACECEDADLWDQHDARRWWTTNLPDLSIPTIAAARA